MERSRVEEPGSPVNGRPQAVQERVETLRSEDSAMIEESIIRSGDAGPFTEHIIKTKPRLSLSLLSREP